MKSDEFSKKLDEACWKGYHKEGNKKMFGKTYPNCVKNTNEEVDLEEGRENYDGLNFLLQTEDDEVFVKVSAGGRELGHVLFTTVDGNTLFPQDLEVDEKYQRQGIAKTMYDYVKSKGYRIRRSGQQTDAGAGFWSKHRPEQNVWENQSGDSNLHDWFSKSKASDGTKGWVQIGGKYAGKPCAKQPGQTTKPKCGSSKMKRNLSAKEEEAAARRKRREDPNPNRKGKAHNVATKSSHKTNESYLKEFFDDRDKGDDGEISKIVIATDRLLKQGYKVDLAVVGAMGNVYRADFDQTGFTPNGALAFKRKTKSFMRPFKVDDDDKYEFEMVGPKHYKIVDVWPEDLNESGKEDRIFYAVQDPDKKYHIYSITNDVANHTEFQGKFGRKLWIEGPFTDVDDAHQAVHKHKQKQGVDEAVVVPMNTAASNYVINIEPKQRAEREAAAKEQEKAASTQQFPLKEPVKEFAHDDRDDRPKFLPWNEFVGDLKAILGDHFDVVENVVKNTTKAKFSPHDPMEFGPTMLYSYYERRPGRPKGAISNRGSIQVGKYIPNTSGLGKQNYISSFDILKGHPFERHFDLTGENVQKIADIIMGNTKGAYQMQSQGVAEGMKSKIAAGILDADDTLNEKWSKKYKDSINCSNPKGFSQRAHCAGRKK